MAPRLWCSIPRLYAPRPQVHSPQQPQPHVLCSSPHKTCEAKDAGPWWNLSQQEGLREVLHQVLRLLAALPLQQHQAVAHQPRFELLLPAKGT